MGESPSAALNVEPQACRSLGVFLSSLGVESRCWAITRTGREIGLDLSVGLLSASSRPLCGGKEPAGQGAWQAGVLISRRAVRVRGTWVPCPGTLVSIPTLARAGSLCGVRRETMGLHYSRCSR